MVKIQRDLLGQGHIITTHKRQKERSERQHTGQRLGEDGLTGMEAGLVYMLEASPFTMTHTAHSSLPQQLELVWKPAEHIVNRQLQ